MTDQIIIDLGAEYGEIAVEPIVPQGGLTEAGAEGIGETVKVKLQELLRAPLTGLGLTLRQTLPNAVALDSADYTFDEFTVQFQVGLETESGLDAGVVVKIIPSGAFNCTYTWKRRP